MPGQFVKLGVMGVGEAPISICTAKSDESGLELCIRNAGRVTNAVHRQNVGDTIWVRGPYGNGFPMEEVDRERPSAGCWWAWDRAYSWGSPVCVAASGEVW